jgi:hypothetical protein
VPTYLVRFDAPVIDQPEHPLARREVRELEVHAPSAEDAKMHAIRVTVGPGHITEVVEKPEPSVLVVDA